MQALTPPLVRTAVTIELNGRQLLRVSIGRAIPLQDFYDPCSHFRMNTPTGSYRMLKVAHNV